MLFVATVSCNRQTSDVSYYWNPDYEYGTFYPSFLGKIDRAENGKGFGVKNDDCELWADCYLIEIEGEDSLVFPQNYLKGANKASVVLDTTYQDNGIAIMNKVIACQRATGLIIKTGGVFTTEPLVVLKIVQIFSEASEKHFRNM